MSKIDKLVQEGTDEEVLAGLSRFLDRVDIATQLVEEEEGIITHSMLFITSGDKTIKSDVIPFEWPLTLMPMPEAFEGKLN